MIADLVYLGDRGYFADIPCILGFRNRCSEHDRRYHLVYSVKGELIGTLGVQEYMHEMKWITPVWDREGL